ncbi:MAG: DUF3090 family protein [Acidimicrobiales bacterium]
MSSSFELSPEWVTVGTVGPAGHRTFYIQASEGDRLVTLRLEKLQVGAVADLLEELLRDRPAVPAGGDAPGLREPVLAEWVVGNIQMSYDASVDRVVMVAEELTAEDEDDSSGAVARIAMTPAQAGGLVKWGRDLVGSGRAICELCGYPMDTEGHSCPKANGNTRPRL